GSGVLAAPSTKVSPSSSAASPVRQFWNVVKGLVLGWSEWWRWGGLWLSISFEVAFEDKSDDKICYDEANRISDHSSDCSCPVRIVEIQLCIYPVFYLQDGESEDARPYSHLIFGIHALEFLCKPFSAFQS